MAVVRGTRETRLQCVVNEGSSASPSIKNRTILNWNADPDLENTTLYTAASLYADLQPHDFVGASVTQRIQLVNN